MQGQEVEASMSRTMQQQTTLQIQKAGADHARRSKTANESDDEKAFLPHELIQNRAFLPDDLIQKIIVRMGFPAVFKARLLSKFWYIKFHLLSQSVRSLSHSLRNEIVSVSANWTTYCPAFFNQKHILGYDRACSTWKQMSFDLCHLVPAWSSVTVLASAGSLLCVVCDIDLQDEDEDDDSISECENRILVTNVLTKSWQEIDNEISVEVPGWMPDDHVRILQAGPDRYMLVLLNVIDSQVETYLYDSSCRTWTATTASLKNSDGPATFGICVNNSAYLDGKLYCLCLGKRKEDPCQLWAHHVTDPCKTWTAIPHRFGSVTVVEGGIFLCGEKVIVVIWCTNTSAAPCSPVELKRIKKVSRNLYTLSNVIRIYELNVNTLVLVEVCRGPPGTALGVGLYKQDLLDNGDYSPQIQYASDADYIYFGQANPIVPVMTYNVHSHKWGFLPPPCYTLDFSSIVEESSRMGQFRPGLNPFAIV